MRLIRKLFSINTLILFFALLLLYASYEQILEAFYDKNKLVFHSGVVKDKKLVTEIDDQTKRLIFFFTLDNNQEYRVSRTAQFMDEKLSLGDSVKFYTKKLGNLFGNSVVDDYGGSFTSHNPNEVFEVISCKDNFLILDFDYNLEHLKKLLWVGPFFSLSLIGLFFYRRSGYKSPFVIQSDD